VKEFRLVRVIGAEKFFTTEFYNIREVTVFPDTLTRKGVPKIQGNLLVITRSIIHIHSFLLHVPQRQLGSL